MQLLSPVVSRRRKCNKIQKQFSVMLKCSSVLCNQDVPSIENLRLRYTNIIVYWLVSWPFSPRHALYIYNGGRYKSAPVIFLPAWVRPRYLLYIDIHRTWLPSCACKASFERMKHWFLCQPSRQSKLMFPMRILESRPWFFQTIWILHSPMFSFRCAILLCYTWICII